MSPSDYADRSDHTPDVSDDEEDDLPAYPGIEIRVMDER